MKQKKCKNCGDLFTPMRSTLQKYCIKPACLTVLIETEKAKKWVKEKAKKKQELMTVQDWVKIAQQAFNAYIRERDKGNNCISCGKIPKKPNAGHYFNANNHWNVRFDEDNVHIQCEHCNTYLSGNLIYYTDGLREKIGTERINQLIEKARITRKYTVNELKEITRVYKEKIKNIKNN